MNSIQLKNKKKIIVLFCIFAATARAGVKPIYSGENIWKLVERIGIEADAIENKVCNMPADTRCYYEIRQTDIGQDGFTITAPGVYCLAENVTVPNSKTGITIESDCVVLDLKGRSLDGQGLNFNAGIEIDGTAVGLLGKPANVVVKNGVVKRTGDDGVFVLDATGPVKLSNLRVTDCGEVSQAGIHINNSPGVLVEDSESSMHILESNGFLVDSSNYCVLKNCIARGNKGADVYYPASAADQEKRKAGFNINSDRCCLIECKAFYNYFHGFMIKKNLNFFHRCIALHNGDEGFMNYWDADQNVYSECISIRNGWSIDGHDGFDIKGGKNVIRRCIAVGNDDNGIDINGGTGNQVLECSVVGNGSQDADDGLAINTSKATNTKVFTNAANHNGSTGTTNYDSSISLKKKTPTAATKYWTNVEP